jgi:CBS domain-containing protein
MANAALWYGLLKGVPLTYEDITQVLDFEVARENFVSAARLGLGAHFTWPGQENIAAQQLLLDTLIPLAKEGLEALTFDSSDIDRYLGVIQERVESLQTGSRWQIDSMASMKADGTRSERLTALVAATASRQAAGDPVHRWELANIEEGGEGKKHFLRIEQLMTTDLFTVNQDELVDLVASVMNWHHIRHVPVEDNLHRLVGLVTYRSLLRLLAEDMVTKGTGSVPVSSIMETDVITVNTRSAVCRWSMPGSAWSASSPRPTSWPSRRSCWRPT